MSARTLAAAAAVLLALLALAGCGRRGSPMPPPGQSTEGTVPARADEPGGVRAPKQPFILDPLL